MENEPIVGTEGDDDLRGTNGADVIRGLGGDDVLAGLGGDDTLDGGAGDDVLRGGAGADVLVGGVGFDTADHSASSERTRLVSADGVGEDAFDSLSEIERVVASAEAGGVVEGLPLAARGDVVFEVDLIAGRASFQNVRVGGPAETVEIANFRDFVGNRRDDVFLGDAQDNAVGGSTGDDLLRGGGGSDTLDYTVSAPLISSVIFGLDGAVTLIGDEPFRGAFGIVLGRDDVAAFDAEAGTLDVFETVIADEADAASNTIDASGGLPGPVSVEIDLRAQRVEATFVEAVDGFAAGEGFGLTVVGFGRATGGAGGDVIQGDRGANALRGGAGDDLLRGRGGDDDLRGGRGDDRLDGQGGDDALRGGGGDDRLFGQGGDDVIRGGRGADALGGGNGSDTFVFSGGDIAAGAGRHVDVVIDFEAQDAVLLAGRRFSAEAAFDLALEEAVIGGVGFALNGGGNQIVLRADGRDADAAIAADEVFARLRFDADDLAL